MDRDPNSTLLSSVKKFRTFGRMRRNSTFPINPISRSSIIRETRNTCILNKIPVMKKFYSIDNQKVFSGNRKPKKRKLKKSKKVKMNNFFKNGKSRNKLKNKKTIRKKVDEIFFSRLTPSERKIIENYDSKKEINEKKSSRVYQLYSPRFNGSSGVTDYEIVLKEKIKTGNDLSPAIKDNRRYTIDYPDKRYLEAEGRKAEENYIKHRKRLVAERKKLFNLMRNRYEKGAKNTESPYEEISKSKVYNTKKFRSEIEEIRRQEKRELKRREYLKKQRGTKIGLFGGKRIERRKTMFKRSPFFEVMNSGSKAKKLMNQFKEVQPRKSKRKCYYSKNYINRPYNLLTGV